MRKTIFLIFLAGLFFPLLKAHSEEVDSIATTKSLHELSLNEIIIPTALVGVSSLFVFNQEFIRCRNTIQNSLSALGEKKFKADDYIQYAPMLAVHSLNLCGISGKHRFKDRMIIMALSYATMGILVQTMKYTFREQRPDGTTCNSFPSGHTATAFMGAELLHKEYKGEASWIGYLGYLVAGATGYLRIFNNRHYINDVLAGACIGILSVKFAYWLYPKWFQDSSCPDKRVRIIGIPYYSSRGWGFNLSIAF